MAGASFGLWNNLPDIIIIEILSFLSLKDRLNASSVCKTWRNCLFYPKLWREIVFRINSCDKTVNRRNQRAKLLSFYCGRFVKEAIIEVNSLNPIDVLLCKEILKNLSYNRNLRALSLRPRGPRLEWVDYPYSHLIKQYAQYLIEITQRAVCLEHLSLGCIEELLNFGEYLLTSLAEYQATNIHSLHISTIKEVPGCHPIFKIDTALFKPFCNLEYLSIDYDYVCDNLLYLLSRDHNKPLLKLNINVHPVNGDYHVVTKSAWRQLSKHSPNLEVTLTLLHFHDSAEKFCRILNGDIPLKHFRVYFSTGFDIDVLKCVALNYSEILKSFVLVHSLDIHGMPHDTFSVHGIDPLVIFIWKCQELTEITVVGYEINADNLIAISRLRGEKLKKLDVPYCCITTYHMEQRMRLSTEEAYNYLAHQVSYDIQKPWQPIPTNVLPTAFSHVTIHFGEAYLTQLLRDQQW